MKLRAVETKQPELTLVEWRAKLRQYEAESPTLDAQRAEALERGDRATLRAIDARIQDNLDDREIAKAQIDRLRKEAAAAGVAAKESAQERCRLEYEDEQPRVAPLAVDLQAAMRAVMDISKAASAAGLVGAEAAQFEPPPPLVFSLAARNAASPTIEISAEFWAWCDRAEARIACWKREDR